MLRSGSSAKLPPITEIMTLSICKGELTPDISLWILILWSPCVYVASCSPPLTSQARAQTIHKSYLKITLSCNNEPHHRPCSPLPRSTPNLPPPPPTPFFILLPLLPVSLSYCLQSVYVSNYIIQLAPTSSDIRHRNLPPIILPLPLHPSPFP